MFQIDPSWVLKAVGVETDPEILELGALFLFQLKAAPDKKVFVKESLRRALGSMADNVRRTR